MSEEVKKTGVNDVLDIEIPDDDIVEKPATEGARNMAEKLAVAKQEAKKEAEGFKPDATTDMLRSEDRKAAETAKSAESTAAKATPTSTAAKATPASTATKALAKTSAKKPEKFKYERCGADDVIKNFVEFLKNHKNIFLAIAGYLHSCI